MEGWSLRFVPIVCKNVCKAILYVYITDYYVRRIPKNANESVKFCVSG